MRAGLPPRVLCISPFFAPLGNAEAFCGGKVGLELMELGLDLAVYRVDYTGSAKFTPDRSSLWAPLGRITTAIPPSGRRPKVLSAPLGLRYQTLDWSRWVAAVVDAARQEHRKNPFDVVYSRSLPNVAHVAGYWVSRALRRPWVANFNDPWDLEATHLLPQDREKRPRNLKTRVSDFWLRRVTHLADVLTFPCARLRDYHLRLAPPGGICEVIPHIGYGTKRGSRSDCFRLLHAGNLGSGESTRRNSTLCLLRAIRAFFDARPEARARFLLVLVGSVDRPTMALAGELGIGENIFSTGRVSYSESLEHMAGATVCLLVEGNMPEGIYLPSKLPDYLHAGRPVIALSPAVGTIADLVPATGLARVPVDAPDLIQREIARYFDLWASGEIDLAAPSEELKNTFSGPQIGRSLSGIFSRLCSGEQGAAGQRRQPAKVGAS